MRRLAALLLLLLLCAAPARADDAAFRALYKELVETNTAFGPGDCTLAARRVAARMQADGFPAAQLEVFVPPGHAKEGGLIATLPGADPAAQAILLLGHLDVVAARREDWTPDPFTLGEADGMFFGRGAADMKALIAIWADSLARMAAGPRPRRTLRMMLTCGEEGLGLNGLRWLIANRPATVRAAYALNEGGGGRVDAGGKPVALHLQVLEKTYQDYRFETTNPGGHSSLPRADNAIVTLGKAVARLAAFTFPVRLNDTTRAFLTRSATAAEPTTAGAMRALAADPANVAAPGTIARDPFLNATLRTTCVVTRFDAGHANNALPQRATAIVNCRIIPGDTIAGTLATLRTIAADPAVRVDAIEVGDIAARPQALPADLLRAAEQLAHEMFPGVPVLPTMTVMASDAPALIRFGVPVYGPPGILFEADGGGIHGLNERVRVRSVMDGRAYLFRLLRLLADAP